MTIHDIKIGQTFHAKRFNRYTGPRILTLVGVAEFGNAFLVLHNGQVNIWLNVYADIVLAGKVL